MIKKLVPLLILLLSVNGCAFFSSSSSKSKPSNGERLPKAPATVVPGGSGNNWRYIGTSSDGQLVVEIDDNSIHKTLGSNNTQLVSFADRKMVVSITQFTYPANQPKFKYLISNWQIDCDNQKYIILDSKLYNTTGTEIGRYDYRNNNDVKWLKFGSGSIADLEYAHVCHDQNRNLGY